MDVEAELAAIVAVLGAPDAWSVIDLFTEDAPARLAAMHARFGADDGAGLELEAHTLKGAAAALGLVTLAQSCSALEAARAGRVELDRVDRDVTEALRQIADLRTARARSGATAMARRPGS